MECFKTEGVLLLTYMEMSETLSEVMDTNVFVVSSSGKILGNALSHQVQSERMKEILKTGQGTEGYVQRLFQIKETLSNIEFESEYSVFPIENKNLF